MAQRSVIRHADDEFGVSDFPAWLDVMDARAVQLGFPRPPRPLGEAPDAEPVVATMNHGRWLAACGCGSAVMLFRGEAGRWFWCPSCGNPGAGGKLRPVLWPTPAERARIERDMESLPTGLAHWDPAVEAEQARGRAAQRAYFEGKGR